MTDLIRLDKKISAQLTCSRSEAVRYIESGLVTVDGVISDAPGLRIAADQRVALLPDAKLNTVEEVTILLHKPTGYDTDPETIVKLITPENLSSDDRSGIHFIKRHLKALTIADPLGRQSSGLMVLTQDWRIARKLIDDAARVEQEYIVEISGSIVEDGLTVLNQGVRVNGKLMPIKVSWQNESKLRFALKDVHREQIVSLCKKVGLEVVAIKRIRIGRLPLSSLEVGKWRYLLGYEQF
jgi:23S rRNA pseudouridine2604 synthase